MPADEDAMAVARRQQPGRGAFLVLEGIDGSGTTTQASRLQEYLLGQGYQAVVTREPTPGPVGLLIRQALQGRLQEQDKPVALDFRAMALLFAADRVDHNQRVIEPNLAAGRVVISDRYVLSSLLYQSLTAPAGEDWMPWLREINSTARTPDLTVVLDTSAQVAAERRAARGEERELYEVDELQRELAKGYARANELLAERVAILDGNSALDAVFGAIVEAVMPALPPPQ